MFIDIHARIGYGALNTIFDVGANTGQTWKEFRSNEPNAQIYCFEPVSDSFNELYNATKKDNNCVAEKVALGDLNGEMEISVFENTSPLNSLKNHLMNQNDRARIEVINVETLDNYCGKKGIETIDLLKIDTEGFELQVLTGSKQMLTSGNITFIYAEVGFNNKDNRHTPFHILNNWMQDFDYYFFAMYQLAGHSWKEGGYYGNALFVHRNVFNP